MSKYTKDDIKFLADQIRSAKNADRPLNLLTGAGCSVSAGMPLANELVKEIHEKHKIICERSLKDKERDDYGACMSCLPARLRSDLLKPHLKKAKINWAHIAIASLMEAEFVSRF